MEMENIVKLAVDHYHGNVKKYSDSESADVLYQALVELNGGRTYLDIHDVQSGKAAELFALVEKILTITVEEGLKGDEFFNTMVEYVNVAEGDAPVFKVKDSTLFVMSEIADGTQALRRQRIAGEQKVTVPTKTYGIRIYEELDRILSKRADFNELISKVTESVLRHMRDQIFTVFSNLSAAQMGGTTYFPVVGASYDEEALLELVDHVEAAAGGKPARIIGTRSALRKISTSIVADSTKEDYYNQGFMGRFNGIECIAIPQRHQVGSTQWLMDNNSLMVIAGDDRPIKVVREGNPLVLLKQATENMDLTQEYLYIEKFGIGVVTAGVNTGIGKYLIPTA